MNRQIALLFFILFALPISAQKNPSRIPDSLKQKNYEYLDDKIYELRKDSARASLYAYAFLNKAKKEQNSKETINAYQNLLHLSPQSLRIAYADSMIHIAKKSKDSELIGSSYLTKGTVYYGQRMQQQAMDEYLTANHYISQTSNEYLIHKVKYCIAQTKFYAGFYDEAASLLKQCIGYYKNGQPRPYLNSLHSLGLCYNRLGDYEKCSKINALGISEGRRLNAEEMMPYFKHSEGINEYFKKNYHSSVKNIESSIDAIRENNDYANLEIGYFYIGKSYWALNQKEKAAGYFKLVDQIFSEKKILRRDLRQAFELMITYYKTKKDLKSQLYYIDQLLKADTLLTESKEYIVGKIHKQYDTKELLLEKERIAAENETMSAQLIWEKHYDRIFGGVILLLFLAIIGVTGYHYRTRRIYKKNYELLMGARDAKKSIAKAKSEKSPITNMNTDTVSLLLKQLDNFEKDRRFLDKDWNLTTLSAAFKTNPKYLASILDHYRDKGINDYINGLRIDYIISMLRTQPLSRLYKYESLAKEAGFSTTERFTKAFLAKTGIAPSYFIAQIKKEKPE